MKGTKRKIPLKERQRIFAELMVQGWSLVDAYLKAGYKGNRPRKEISTCAALLYRNPLVVEYMEELRKPRREAAIMSHQEKREYLARVIRASPADVTADSDLCQSIRTFKKGSVNVVMPSKLRAIELDARLAGELWPGPKGEMETPAMKKLADALFKDLPEGGLP